jgi:osmoprotectant transport system ATP-binding protein
MEPVIAFRDVSYEIRGKAVLRHLDLEVAAGETLVLLGRSGSGKTTALRMVNALLAPTSGEVRVGGKPTRDWDPILLRRSIGYVIQEAGLFPHFTVARNVSVVPSLQGWESGRTAARVADLLGRLGLPPEEFASRLPRQLSGGQRQRVGVARALAAEPSILLMDEPFGAVDPVTRRGLQKEFRALRAAWTKTSPLTSVIVTHDVREALLLATRIALLHEGRLEIVATPRDFLAARTEEARTFLDALEDLPET